MSQWEMAKSRMLASAGVAVAALLVAAAAAADNYSFRLTAADPAATRRVVIHRPRPKPDKK
jgi:hypothetical protein